MSQSVLSAVAVDLGASSLRYSVGSFDGSRIEFRPVEQLPHEPVLFEGRLVWDWSLISQFVRKACEFADSIDHGATIGFDTWGVDHGFLDKSGQLIGPPVCYRDPSHQKAFDLHPEWRPRLFQWTGIQHQPFNTVYQLAARLSEDPELSERVSRIVLLPDLAALEAGAGVGSEWTHASTTQMLGTDGGWCDRAFQLCRWPNLFSPCSNPGIFIGKTGGGSRIVRVAGHDTASAVIGLGTLAADQAFLNLGSWSILGCILDEPILSGEAEANNFSNELAADRKVRFLKNIPGFYVINRVHEELGVDYSIADWLSRADLSVEERVDLFHPSLFNPDSMLVALSAMLQSPPDNAAGWAGIALASMAETIAEQLQLLQRVANVEINTLRVSGGGSKSSVVLQAIADSCACTVAAGPEEATTLGNLGLQFVAAGSSLDLQSLGTVILNSIEIRTTGPRE